MMLAPRRWSRITSGSHGRLSPACLPASGPRDAFSTAVPGWAETAALAVVAGAGAALRGAECGEPKRRSRRRRFAASTQASHARPPWLFGPSTLLLTLSPLPQGYLPLSAFALSTNRSPTAHFLTRRSYPQPLRIICRLTGYLPEGRITSPLYLPG